MKPVGNIRTAMNQTTMSNLTHGNNMPVQPRARPKASPSVVIRNKPASTRFGVKRESDLEVLNESKVNKVDFSLY
jgi:hypothetical protein